MKKNNYSKSTCPIERAVDCVGDVWSILIMRDAIFGMTRFDQFRKSLGIAPTMLTQRLAALTKHGLLEKKRYSKHPPREEYVLTPAGRDFLPVLAMFGAWGRKHRNKGKLVYVIDTETGKIVKPIVVDAVTGAELGVRPIHFVIQ